MSRLRILALVLAFAAATAMVFGTAGFSSVTAERGITVSVADSQDEANVGVDICHKNRENAQDKGGATPVTVTVTNQLAVDLKVTDVSPSKNGNLPDSIGAGKTETFKIRLDGSPSTATVAVESVFGGFSADINVDVGPRCEGVGGPDSSTNESDTDGD